jgi:hypothetical protein
MMITSEVAEKELKAILKDHQELYDPIVKWLHKRYWELNQFLPIISQYPHLNPPPSLKIERDSIDQFWARHDVFKRGS